MRVSQLEKDESRKRIVSSAARLLRERGIDGASVGEIMKDAGMTHGGFYRHFDTKDGLVESALDAAFAELVAPLEDELKQDEATLVGRRFRDFYLSDTHRNEAGRGCPAAALGSEIARTPASVRARFGAGIRKMTAALSRTHAGDAAASEAGAMRDLALMVGAITLARASDRDTGDLILAACRADQD